MKHLEQAVHDHFARLQNAPATATTATTNGATVPSRAPPPATENSISDAGTLGTPFARVNSVEPRSPADQAGLKAEDSIRGFGNVHWLNHERLSKVAEAVQQNEGVSSANATFQCDGICLTALPASAISQSNATERGRIGHNRS